MSPPTSCPTRRRRRSRPRRRSSRRPRPRPRRSRRRPSPRRPSRHRPSARAGGTGWPRRATRAHDEEDDQAGHEEPAEAPALPRRARGRPRRHAARQRPERRQHLHARLVEPVAVASGAEGRGQHVADDARGLGVGELALDAVPHLDADLAVVDGHHQQHAVVAPGVAQLPGLGDADGEVLDGLAVQRAHQQVLELDAAPAVRGRGPPAPGRRAGATRRRRGRRPRPPPGR